MARHYLLCLLLSVRSLSFHAQSPVQQFTANYVSTAGSVYSYTALPASPGSFSGCALNQYTYTWNNSTANHLKLVSFTANAKTYVISNSATVQVKLRRVNNATVLGNRNILYSEILSGTATACPSSPRQVNFRAPYNEDMASFLNNNVLNHGTDNLFTNASNSDGNNNNIERVDVIFPGGIASAIPADAGFILCERGNNNQHDGFRIAAILSIDGNNDPLLFGQVQTCVAGNGSGNGSWGHPSVSSGNKQLSAYVLRKDPPDGALRISSHVNQEIGGVFFSLADLGVVSGQTIYGYALLGPDGTSNPTSTQLLNLSNSSVYPTTTTEAQGGGLDLISINTFFGTNQALSHTGILQFDAFLDDEVPLLQWDVQNQPEGTVVAIERSEDAQTFRPVHTFPYDPTNRTGTYRDSRISHRVYYRLRVQRPQTTIYSRLILLQPSAGIKMYPAIITPGQPINIEMKEEGNYELTVISLTGTVIYSAAFRDRYVLELRRPIAKGMYIVTVTRNGLLAGKKKLVIQ